MPHPSTPSLHDTPPPLIMRRCPCHTTWGSSWHITPPRRHLIITNDATLTPARRSRHDSPTKPHCHYKLFVSVFRHVPLKVRFLILLSHLALHTYITLPDFTPFLNTSSCLMNELSLLTYTLLPFVLSVIKINTQVSTKVGVPLFSFNWFSPCVVSHLKGV